jgi:hypothetical protein
MMEGPCADSEEKHEPASDVDIAVVDSLKALDPKRPIREADISAEVMWFHLNQKFSGFATLTPTAPKPTAITSSSTTIPSPSRFAFSVTSDRYLPAAINV